MFKKTLRIFIFVPVSFIIFCGISSAEVIETKSQVTEVTVYPGSARITRQAQLNLSEGEHTIEFKNIIPYFDENSLTVNGQGKAQVKIFGASSKIKYLTEAANEHVKELEAKLLALQDNIQVKNSDLMILDQKKSFLDSVKLFSGQQIPKDLVTQMPTAEALNSTLQFLATNLADVEKQREQLRLSLRELKKEEQVLNQEFGQLRDTGNQQERSIAVDIACEKGGTFSLEVSYFVNGANWRPVYDARASYKEGQVELTAFGMVTQTTGEDWDDVKLTLSTARPSIGGSMPYVAPWNLDVASMTKIERRNASAQAVVDDIRAQHPSFYLKERGAASVPEEEAEVAYAQMTQSGVSISYNIQRPATIKSDGVESRLPVATQTLKANFEYSAYPKVSTYAYLGSQVTNSKELQLLAGEVNLFLDGQYVGKSNIENVGPGQEFYLYLGINENIKVKREEIVKKIDDVLIGNIPSSTIRTNFQYKLSVENNTGSSVKILLFESMPVSNNDRIKVKIFDVSLEPKIKDWEDRKGVWRWEIPLESAAKKEIFYSFSVERPREMTINGI